jgi:phage tail tape-measure protein
MPSLKRKIRKVVKRVSMNMGSVIGGLVGAAAGTWLGGAIAKSPHSIDDFKNVLKSSSVQDQMASALFCRELPQEYVDRWSVEFLLWKESQTGNREEKKG